MENLNGDLLEMFTNYMGIYIKVLDPFVNNGIHIKVCHYLIITII